MRISDWSSDVCSSDLRRHQMGSASSPGGRRLEFLRIAQPIRKLNVAGKARQGRNVLPCQTRTNILCVMAHMTVSVEYGLHCLLGLIDAGDAPRSARDLALFQGISSSFAAKIFAKLEKAGIVTAAEGVRGGYRLARPAHAISVLELVDADRK